jgi:hypothetical protein
VNVSGAESACIKGIIEAMPPIFQRELNAIPTTRIAKRRRSRGLIRDQTVFITSLSFWFYALYSVPMRNAIKLFLKRIASAAYRHAPSGLPHIFIHSTQRSGSTLLFDGIASQPGMKAVGEPFEERKIRTVERYIHRPRRRYYYLDDTTAQELRQYLDALLSGAFVGGFERTYNPLSVRHHRRTGRNVVKILRTLGCTAWIAGSYRNAYHLLLVRHPIPTVQSRVRNHWEAPIEEFTSDHSLTAALSPEELRAVKRLQDGTEFDRHLAVWLLEHRSVRTEFPRLRELGVYLLSYEHLVAEPEAAASWMSNTLQLPHLGLLHRQLASPSRSTRHSTAETTQAINAGRRDELVGGWQKHVPTKERYRVQEYLACFDIPFYTAHEPFPRNPLDVPPWRAMNDSPAAP